jgi:hypothetical protein
MVGNKARGMERETERTDLEREREVALVER